MRDLPFVARPRVWTWRLLPEAVIVMTIVVYIFGTGPVGWGRYAMIGFLVTLAIGLPVWLRSRALAALPDGVSYTPFFGVSRFIPYSHVREMWVDRRITSYYGGYGTQFLLRIIGSNSHQIKVAMDAYRTEDLHVVAQEMSIRAGHMRLKGLARRLVDGTDAFERSYSNQRY